MTADKLNLVIEQGATFRKSMTYKDASGAAINLTGYTARMQIRKTYGSTVLLSLTTENGRITLGGSAGTITLTISASDTAAIDWDKARYDLELVSGGGEVYRPIEGEVTVSREITT